MTIFADASAIVKLFVPEVGLERIRSDHETFTVSALTLVEVSSAIWGKVRTGHLAASTAQRTSSDVRRQFARGSFDAGQEVIEIPTVSRVLESASRLCGVHGLRAGDAIQLATALTAREVDPSCTRFWVFDQRLAVAAAREGFAVLGADRG